ncbi:hypothetical protein INR49_004295 [Caranx melampygus]|nr:hypothetical protein INR49_004295 [Caranx melampygus]
MRDETVNRWTDVHTGKHPRRHALTCWGRVEGKQLSAGFPAGEVLSLTVRSASRGCVSNGFLCTALTPHI